MDTVDGGNPGNQLAGNFSHYLRGVLAPSQVENSRRISEASTVLACPWYLVNGL